MAFCSIISFFFKYLTLNNINTFILKLSKNLSLIYHILTSAHAQALSFHPVVFAVEWSPRGAQIKKWCGIRRSTWLLTLYILAYFTFLVGRFFLSSHWLILWIPGFLLLLYRSWCHSLFSNMLVKDDSLILTLATLAPVSCHSFLAIDKTFSYVLSLFRLVKSHWEKFTIIESPPSKHVSSPSMHVTSPPMHIACPPNARNKPTKCT